MTSATRRARVLARAAVAAALFTWGPSINANASPSAGRSWTQYHANPTGTGVALAIRTVVTSHRKWTSPEVDGQLYGEPLVFAGAVYVATENDTVYALSSATGRVIWQRHVATAVPSSSIPCGNISPRVGITGTPVVDPARNEIFVVADEFVRGKSAHFSWD